MTRTATANDPEMYAWSRGVLKKLRTVLHLVAVCQFSYAIYYYHNLQFPMTAHGNAYTYGGKFRFLTFLNAIIQAVYFTISVGNDVIGTNEVVPKKVFTIRKVKDYVFAALAFPLALNVGISFWILYAIDREFVFSKTLEGIFPGWLNHTLHTSVVIFIVLEMFTTFRKYPKRSCGLFGGITFMACYIIWVHIIKYFSGVWVYPMLELLELPQRIVFLGAGLVFTVFLYLFGEALNKIVWASELKLIQHKVT